MLKLPQSRGKLFLQASLTKTSRTLKSFMNNDENGNRLESGGNKERNVKACKCKMIPRVGILKVKKERKKVSWKPDLVETKLFPSAMPRKKSVPQKKKVISQSWDCYDSDSDFENPRAGEMPFVGIQADHNVPNSCARPEFGTISKTSRFSSQISRNPDFCPEFSENPDFFKKLYLFKAKRPNFCPNFFQKIILI